MSAEPDQREPILQGSSSEPAYAASLSDAEHGRLVERLEKAALPILEAAGQELIKAGFLGVRAECLKDMASLTVSQNSLEGWLRIQVHQTFGVLITREPVFWMYAVYDGSKLIHGKPGRMQELAPPRASSTRE